MGDSRFDCTFNILSWILTYLFKTKISASAFNRDHLTETIHDGYIEIETESSLEQDQELFFKILNAIHETMKHGEFVEKSVFGHANLQRGEGNYLNDYDYEPEAEDEDNNMCKNVWKFSYVHDDSDDDDDDTDDDDADNNSPFSPPLVYTLKYSIKMNKNESAVSSTDDSDEEEVPVDKKEEINQTTIIDPHMELLKKDAATLCGENALLVEKICKKIYRKYSFYEMDMFTGGQDVFISAAIARLFKEDIELHTALAQFMKETWGTWDPHAIYRERLAAEKKEISSLISTSA